MSLKNSAAYLSEVGRPQDALETNEEAVDLFRQLYLTHPDGNRSGLAWSLMNAAEYFVGSWATTRCARNEQKGSSTYVDNSTRLIPMAINPIWPGRS